MSIRSDAARRLDGWGYDDAAPTAEEVARLRALVDARFPGRPQPRAGASAGGPPGTPAGTRAQPALPPSRLRVPDALADVCATDPRTRALHALGRSFADTVSAARGAFDPAPDVVAAPRDAGEVAAVLEWAEAQGAACVPFGGGTSVVGGVTPPGDRPTVTLQTRAMGRVLEVDAVSRAARIEAGAVGPDLERQLGEHGLTLRFFPQSFELSTLGGWIVTRAGGHFATRWTHIDDLVEAVTAVTPRGLWTSRRLPASGAGPSPDRLLLGSEGVLGVVTEAWVRVLPRPRWRGSASVTFGSFPAGAAAVRAILQAGLSPANCRLLDPTEALLNGAGDGSAAVLVLGWESAHAPIGSEAAAAVDVARDNGGACPGGVRDRDAGAQRDGHPNAEGDPAAAWRRSFLRAPYLRDALIGLGMISETLETAVTWDRFEALHADVVAAVEGALRAVCGDGVVTCRLTHAYPDGAAPYFTVIAPGRPGDEVAQWRDIKQAASEALLAAGGTITHHHAVGRDHRPWYDRQRPDPFAVALAAAKAALDPAGILNPGVLLGETSWEAS